MATKRTNPPPLEAAFDSSAAPAYLIDDERTIVYANPALVEWVGRAAEEVVGKRVVYHSQPDDGDALLTGLCPPPTAMAGERGRGAISCASRDGRLLRRRAEFLPLAQPGDDDDDTGHLVLILAEAADLGPNEPAEIGRRETLSEKLHAAIAAVRRGAEGQGPPPCLIGPTPATALLRRQADAATVSRANCLVVGPPRSGREELARWVHQQSANTTTARLMVVDPGLLEHDQIVDQVEAACRAAAEAPTTLLLLRVDELTAQTTAVVAERLKQMPSLRTIATAADPESIELGPLLLYLATFVMKTARLVDRPGDLPMLAQWCVERANAAGEKQLAGLTDEAHELLALHPWPGGAEELQAVINQAHQQASSPVIQPADLPTTVQQAALRAELPPVDDERIVLDEFLGEIERELIERAITKSGDNKAEAARLLGMTRPRLYRRLARLGMIDAEDAGE